MGHDPAKCRVLVVEGPVIASQMAHWQRVVDHGIDLHLAASATGPNQEWWGSGESQGVPTSLFTPRGWVRRGSLWWTYQGLKQLLLEFRPDIVHIAQEPWALFYLQVPLGSYKVVGHGADNLWIHGNPLENWIRLRRAQRILPRLAGFASWNADGIRLAREHGLPSHVPTLIAPTRVSDPDPFRLAAENRLLHRKQLGIGGEFAVGYVGQLLRRKGVDWLIRSLSEARLPNAQLHLFGAGPDEPRLRQLAAEHKVSATFHGSVAPDRIPETMAAVDLLVVPSRTTSAWTEQFGRVVVEAMLAGTPVIASNSGSLPEVVGVGGVVVPENDVTALAHQLVRFSDSGERERQREAGRAWVQRFTPDVMARAFSDFWATVRSR